MSQRALFLDRDGVINVDHGHVGDLSRFDWVAGVFDTVRAARQVGFLTIVVTNQAGIAHGYYTEAAFHDLTSWMLARFAAEDAPLTAVYYCPFHPDGTGHYRVANHPDRKPNPGMLLRATAEHQIDLQGSALIGDQESDIEAGIRAGVGSLARFISGSIPTRTRAGTKLHSHAEAATWLLRQFA